MSHSNVLRILYLEDNIDDAGLIHFEMKKLSVPFDLRIADCKEQYEKLLSEVKPNIILSDYNVPGYNIFDAINKARAFDPLIPFIVISGVIGESKAVEAMLSGANDCIMKDKMVRLIPSIERELRDTEIKRNQSIQHDELILYKDIFRDLVNPAAIFSEYGVLIASNNAFSKIHNLAIDEKTAFSQIYNQPGNAGLFDIIFEKGNYTKEFQIQTNEGNPSIHFSSFKHRNKNETFIVCIETDITEMKNAQLEKEESNKKINALISNLPGVVYKCVFDKKWTMLFLNDKVLPLTGYEKEELINNNKIAFADIIHPDDKERVYNMVLEASKNNSQFSIYYKIVSKMGDTKWVWEKGCFLKEKPNEEIYIEGYIEDITSERQSMIELQKKDEQFRIYLENSPIAIFITDKAGQYQYVNKAAQDLLKFNKEDLLSKSIPEIVAIHDKEKAVKSFTELMATGKLENIEINLLSNKGSEIPVTLDAVEISDNEYIAYCKRK